MTRRKDPEPDAVPDPALPAPEAARAAPDPALPQEDILADARPVEELASDPQPDPNPGPQPQQQPRTSSPPRSGGVLAPILGGAMAAIGGFALSHFNVIGLGASDGGADLAALSGKLDAALAGQATAVEAVRTGLAALDGRVTALETAPPPAPPDLSRLDTLDQRLAAIEVLPSDGNGSTAALAAKLGELERRLAAPPEAAASADVQAKLDAALSRLDAAEAAAADRAAEAEAAAAGAKRKERLDALSAAVAEGRPFSTELQALADPALAAALGSAAPDGVPSLTALQAAFPDAARDALRIAREVSQEDGWSERLVDFLAAQTGARPLTPQEGTTPDAILSRAEFALSEGRVADALAELDPLDPAAKAALDGWIDAAKRHDAAVAALKAAAGGG